MKIKEVKENILLAFIIIILLFVVCFVIYTQWDKIEVESVTNMEFAGGTDSLSQELQYIIPYVTIRNASYLTAYQDDYVTLDQIDNDILLTKAYFANQKSSFISSEVMDKLIKYYGNDSFVMYKDFNVNGKNSCTYANYTFTCTEEDYDGILYKADRNISNINITEDIIYLTESILFYSEEVINDVAYYQVYDNGLYNNVTMTFSSNDLNRSNLSLEEYIDLNLMDYRVEYQSNFIHNGDDYNWIGTEKI